MTAEVPAGHVWQTTLVEDVDIWPSLQPLLMQADLPCSSWYCPEAHVWHVADVPATVWYLPAAQSVHEVAWCALLDRYLPSAHALAAVHVTAPPAVAKVPLGQSTQLYEKAVAFSE